MKTNESKLSKIFETMRYVDQGLHRVNSYAGELSTFKLAVKPANKLWLLQNELKDLEKELAYIREILNSD